jgi:hypothetical protein
MFSSSSCGTSARNAIASSTILPATVEGRTVVGFDASEVMREVDGQRILRESAQGLAMNYDLQQRRKMLRSFSGIDRMLRSFGGIDQIAREISGVDRRQLAVQGSIARSTVEGLRSAVGHSAGVYTSLEKAREILRPYSHLHLQSNVLGQGRMLASLGLSISVAQAFEAHGIASAYSEGWRLQFMRSIRTPALQSILNATTTFGPVVVPPDYNEAPLDYQPDLRWLLPETATESGEPIDVEEWWAAVVAWAQGLAVYHRTEVLLSVMGNGSRFLIRVCKHPAVQATASGTVAGAIGGTAGGVVSGDVATDAISNSVSGGAVALITYLLSRR